MSESPSSDLVSWTVHQTSEGQTFYYSSELNRSVIELPEGASIVGETVLVDLYSTSPKESSAGKLDQVDSGLDTDVSESKDDLKRDSQPEDSNNAPKKKPRRFQKEERESGEEVQSREESEYNALVGRLKGRECDKNASNWLVR